MTRHSKNVTAGAAYRYYEKQKDSYQSGYGTQEKRLSKDSIKVNIQMIEIRDDNDELFESKRNSTVVH